jgi:YfiH family protein
LKSTITYKSFNKYKEIAHFCTTRHGGVSVGNFASFNLSPFSGDNINDVEKNIALLAQIIDIDKRMLVIPFQNHGSDIKIIDETFIQLSDIEQKEYLYGVDALISNTQGICIGVTTADCVPIFIYDPILQVIAVIHAGWRGTCAGIAEKTIRKMIELFNCDATNLQVVIGPSISPENYTVGEELIEKFTESGFPTQLIFKKTNEQIHLDLWKANTWLIENTGVPANQIEIYGKCTYTDHNNFYSARRLGIKSGRMLSGILLKK